MNQIIKDGDYHIDYCVFKATTSTSFVVEGEIVRSTPVTEYRIFSRASDVKWANNTNGWVESLPISDYMNGRLPGFRTMEEAYEYLVSNISEIA